MTEVNENKLYVRANMLTSLGTSDLPKSSTDWSYLTETPIFQLLKVNQQGDRVEDLPINYFLEKETNSVRLVLIDNYMYADHSYKYLPSINTAIQKHNEKWPALIDSYFEGMEAPLKEYHDPHLQE